MKAATALLLAAALLMAQVALAADAPEPVAEPVAEPSPEQSPEEVENALDEQLAALGIPTSDLTGKLLPGVNPVQINSLLTSILNTRATADFQQETQENNQDSAAVLVALANPAAVPALSPSARTQYDAVTNLFKQPDFANPPGTTAAIGRKLMMLA